MQNPPQPRRALPPERWVLTALLLACLPPGARAPGAPDPRLQATDPFDKDSVPGIQEEFKVEIGARIVECFYQLVKAESELHVYFQAWDCQ